jgi:hypothetical protein
VVSQAAKSAVAPYVALREIKTEQMIHQLNKIKRMQKEILNMA